MVDLFAEYFASVYSKPDNEYTDLLDLSYCKLQNCDVFHKLQRLDDRVNLGPDGAPTFLLKRCAFTLTRPIFQLFNLSLSQKGYPCFGKVVLSDQSLNLVTQLMLRTTEGQAYLHTKYAPNRVRDRSTTYIVVYQNDIVQPFEDRLQVHSTCTDVSKAFDIIDINIPLNKLKAIGINGSILKLIRCFFTNRVQYVKFNNFVF